MEYAHEIIRILTLFNRVPSTINVLDYGLGLAKWALLAKAFGCNVFGTEVSEGKKKHAQECGIKVINLSDAADKQFDVINVDQVLEHVREPFLLLCQLKRCLKSEGIMKVCVPDGGDIKIRLKYMDWNAPKGSKKSLLPVHPLEHINCFNRKALITLVKRAGFNIANVSKLMKFPVIIKNNPLRERNPRNIFIVAREEWRHNFTVYPTYLLLKKI